MRWEAVASQLFLEANHTFMLEMSVCWKWGPALKASNQITCFPANESTSLHAAAIFISAIPPPRIRRAHLTQSLSLSLSLCLSVSLSLSVKMGKATGNLRSKVYLKLLFYKPVTHIYCVFLVGGIEGPEGPGVR